MAQDVRVSQPMTLEVLDRHSEALFEFLWCPVCGQEVATDICESAMCQLDTVMYDLTGFQRDLLYVIVGGDEPHGLALKEELGSVEILFFRHIIG
ncbi:hypothetical protein [Halolamina sp. CBA1230]|uniref:DUF7567 family protein n=1 Tax=Halolamina sp. CBA1230 TaxID=1853690 RepID=UPI00374470B6